MAEGSEKEIREGGRAVSASLGQILNLKETEYRMHAHTLWHGHLVFCHQRLFQIVGMEYPNQSKLTQVPDMAMAPFNVSLGATPCIKRGGSEEEEFWQHFRLRVKARRQARRKETGHLLSLPPSPSPCDKDGKFRDWHK